MSRCSLTLQYEIVQSSGADAPHRDREMQPAPRRVCRSFPQSSDTNHHRSRAHCRCNCAQHKGYLPAAVGCTRRSTIMQKAHLVFRLQHLFPSADLGEGVGQLWRSKRTAWGALYSARQWWMAISRSVTLLKTPRRTRLRVIPGKKRSTRLSHDDEVGVKCKRNRGCSAGPFLTSGCL